MNNLIKRNVDFTNELLLENYLYSILITCYIDEDCDNIDVDINFEECYDKSIKMDEIVNNSPNKYNISIEFYTKDKSKLKDAEQEMLNIVYDNINDFIIEFSDKLKPYKELLKSAKYYRDKKLNRILK
jgi:hypothetical protein